MGKGKEWYDFYKGLGICTRCKTRNAEPHKVMCLECADAETERYHRSREKNGDELRRRDNEKYHRLKEQGICVYCKTAKAEPGKTKCRKCSAIVRNRRQRKKADLDRSEWVNYGICYLCGKNPIMKDKRVCEKCYEVRLESIRKICHRPGNPEWSRDNRVVFKKWN